MSEPQMNERTGVSLGLVMSLVGICSMTVGSFAWLQSDVAALKADAAKSDVLVRRMDRIELLICATEDKNRAIVCDQLRKTPQ